MNPLRALFLSLSRMPPVVMLVVIIALAVVVTTMVTGQMGESERKAAQQAAELSAKYNQKQMVVYTIKDIPEGATITADALEEKEVESSKVPVDALSSTSMAVGRIAKGGVPAEQVLSAHDLAPIGVSVGFESKIKEGQRAVTFAVDTNSGVAGFVSPGSHVDIVASVGSSEKTRAEVILSDVEVVAVGQMYQKSSGASGAVPASSITVAVSPDEANKLIKAIMVGKIYMTLRNEKDHSPVATVDVSSMFDKSAPPPMAVTSALPPPPLPGAPDGGGFSFGSDAAPSPPPLHQVEQWTGGKKDILPVPKG